MSTALRERHCRRLEQGSPALPATEAQELLKALHTDWTLDAGDNAIECVFRFKNYYETIAFVNALAWIAHSEDHHPDLSVSYSRCTVRYSTHSVGGLSVNDFICAARLDALRPAAD